MSGEEKATSPALAVRLEYKIGLPDYSSATVSMHLGGITQETTDEEIESMVDRGKIVYSKMGQRITEQAAEIRDRKGW